MSDKLKNQIDQKRGEFEVYGFDAEQGWGEIASNFEMESKWPVWKKVSVAACLALVIAASLFQAIAFKVKAQDQGLSEIETYYQSEINYRIALVKSQLDDHRILEDLEAMDQAFRELKTDLKDNVDNEEVVTAMLENYRLKLRILEEILGELEKENSESVL